MRKLCLLSEVVFLALTSSLLAQSGSVPFLNQPVSPLAVEPGGSGFTLYVNGTGFVTLSET